MIEGVVRYTRLWVEPVFTEMNYYRESSEILIPFTFKPNLETSWSGITIKTNSMGLKDQLEPGEMDTQCIRVLVVGGSYTTGYGVDYKDSFPRQLESILNAENQQCFHVINGAQNGFSSSDILGMLKLLIRVYQPHLIVYSVNRFALNESATVNSNGNLIAGGIIFDWLRIVWNMNGTHYDTSGNEPLELAADETHGILREFYSFRYFSRKLRGLVESFAIDKCSSDNCLNLNLKYLDAQLELNRFMDYSALYFSPSRQKKFYTSIDETIELAQDRKIPLFFMTIDFFLNPEKLKSVDGVHFLELSQMTKMDNATFFKMYSLPWDFHFNAKGNFKIAGGLGKILQSTGQEERVRISNEYTQSAKAKKMKLNELVHAKLRAEINFKNKRNLHQIVSGLRPDQRLNDKRISLIINSSESSEISVAGELRGEKPLRVELLVRNGHRDILKKVLSIAPGNFEVRNKVENDVAIVDVYLRCLSSNCENIEYHQVQMN